jgi:hypothetical protein
MGIEDAIGLFLAAQARHGIPAPSNPASDDDLAAIAAAIAPMRLPFEAVALWKTFQVEHGALAAGWPLASARYALETWQYDVDSGMGIFAKCLFPIAFEYQAFKWIELHGPADLDGGRIWEGAYDTSEIRSVAPSLADLIVGLVDGWDAGFFEHRADKDFSHLQDDQAWYRLLRDRFGTPLAVDGWTRHSWPARWKSLSGLAEAAPRPSDAITRIVDLTNGTAWLDGETKTLEGYASVVIGTGLGVRALVRDATGQIEVWVPTKSDPFRDIDAGRVQVDVVRADDRTIPRELRGLPPRGIDPIPALQAAFAHLRRLSSTPEAIVTAVRRVGVPDEPT